MSIDTGIFIKYIIGCPQERERERERATFGGRVLACLAVAEKKILYQYIN
jgi:hypothetical protein